MNIWQWRNEKGLTLISVVASSAILSVIIYSYLNLVGYSRLGELRTNNELNARLLAEQKLALYQKNGLPAQNPSTEGIYTIYGQNLPIANKPEPPSHPNSVTLEAFQLDPNNSPVLLAVTVSWSNQ